MRYVTPSRSTIALDSSACRSTTAAQDLARAPTSGVVGERDDQRHVVGGGGAAGRGDPHAVLRRGCLDHVRLLSQGSFVDLAAVVAGQLVDGVDAGGDLVRREPLGEEGPQRRWGQRRVAADHDHGGQFDAEHVVRQPDDRGLGDRRVLVERRLDCSVETLWAPVLTTSLSRSTR